MLRRLWEPDGPRNPLWATCGNAFLAQALDQLFRVYSDPRVHGADPAAWARVHGRVLEDVLAGRARVEVNAQGVVVAADTSAHSYTLRLGGGTGADNAAVIGRPDTVRLLAGRATSTRCSPTRRSALNWRWDPASAACRRRLLAPGPLRTLESPAGSEDGREAADAVDAIGDGVEAPAVATPAPTNTGTPHTPDHPADTGALSQLPPGGAEGAAAHDPPAGVPADAEARDPAPGADGLGAAGRRPSPRTGGSIVPSEVRERARAAFEGFVGNENAIYRITNDLIAAALADPPHLSKNYLLTGEPSTGKTEIARRMAAALALPFVKLEGRGLTPKRLFDLATAELRDRGVRAEPVGRMSGRQVLRYPPMVVFVDEVHLVPRAVQEGFLTVLEPNDRHMDAGSHVARMDLVTFIFATTRASDIDNAFRTRCAGVPLRVYTLEEVAEIIPGAGPRTPGGRRTRTSGSRSWGTWCPGRRSRIASELKTEILVTEHPGRTVLEHLDRVRRARETDERGLTVLDWRYLETLERWGPLGESNITTRLGTVDRDRVLEEVEPFLLRLGLMTKGLRGREITPEGRRYLRGAVRPG